MCVSRNSCSVLPKRADRTWRLPGGSRTDATNYMKRVTLLPEIHHLKARGERLFRLGILAGRETVGAAHWLGNRRI